MATNSNLLSSVYGKITHLLMVISHEEDQRKAILGLIDCLWNDEKINAQLILYVNDDERARDDLFNFLVLNKIKFDVYNKSFHSTSILGKKEECAVILGNGKFSIWAQDPFLVKLNNNSEQGSVDCSITEQRVELMESQTSPLGDAEFADSLSELTKEFYTNHAKDEFLHFHGGNVLNDNKSIFIGRNDYELSIQSILVTFFPSFQEDYENYTPNEGELVIEKIRKKIEEQITYKLSTNDRKIIPIGPSIKKRILFNLELFLSFDKWLTGKDIAEARDKPKLSRFFWMSTEWRTHSRQIINGIKRNKRRGGTSKRKTVYDQENIRHVFEKLIHIDTFLTPVGEIETSAFQTLEVESRYQKQLRNKEMKDKLPAVLFAQLVDLDGKAVRSYISEELDNICEKLDEEGYQICFLKMPEIKYNDKLYFGTYNNCHVEIYNEGGDESKERRRIWLPSLTYGAPTHLLEKLQTIEDENIHRLEHLGFEVILIQANFHYFLEKKGGLHCVSKVLRRGN
ncbi:MAG: hypothetical protein MI974_00190 [Chitinophagales bacterium]|nr:hypothetical protein [Chitinophagales bacterium]